MWMWMWMWMWMRWLGSALAFEGPFTAAAVEYFYALLPALELSAHALEHSLCGACRKVCRQPGLQRGQRWLDTVGHEAHRLPDTGHARLARRRLPVKGG